MSKTFPALRIYGNEEAGARHIKRGLYELFKTQELMKHMGVPVFSRSVDVNEYTSITVEVQKKQTLVIINSNPPSLPEIVPPPELEREEILELCPSAFLIRSLSERGSDPWDTDGYLIGYNHRNRKWETVRYLNAQGSSVAVAGNLGWYHANDGNASGLYSHCDVVSWRGQSSPDFAPTCVAGDASGDNKRFTYLQKTVYFQGRAFSTPNYVIGGCILDDSRVDYLYVHCVILVASGSDNYQMRDVTYRQKLSTVLASSGDPDWDTVKTVFASDFTAALGIYSSVEEFAPPRSCAYVDENGYSYVCREYVSDEAVFQQSGNVAFIKYNLRDMSWEVLSQSAANSADLVAQYSSDPFVVDQSGLLSVYPSGINFDNNGEGTYIFAGTLTADNVSNPWIFYVFSGTQDLYYLALEHTYFHSSSYQEEQIDFADDIVTYHGTGYGHTDIVVYKNGDEHDRIRIMELSYNHQGYTEGTDNVWNTKEFAVSTKWLYEYHPEIPKCKNYIETNINRNGAGRYTRTHHVEGEDDTIFFSYDFPEAATPDVYGRALLYFEVWVKPSVIAEIADGAASSSAKQEVTFDNSPMRDGYSAMNFSVFPSLLSPLNSWIFSSSHPGPVSMGLYTAQVGSACFGKASNTYYPLRFWGSSKAFYAHDELDDTNPRVPWCADSYAIHRPVRGKKPYMWLQREAETNVEPTPINVFYTLCGDFVISDETPSAGTPGDNPYYAGTVETAVERKGWWMWNKPLGAILDPDGDPMQLDIPHWEDEYWNLASNVLSEAQLNAMTKEIGLNFFHIGIL